MVDRPIRPLWPKGFRNEVQIIGTVAVGRRRARARRHGHQRRLGRADDLALPFLGPVGAVRVGRFGNELVLNPALGDMAESTLDLVVCGTSEAITMVEAGAKVVEEETILEALALAHEAIKKLCAAQLELRDRIGKPKWYEEDVRAGARGPLRLGLRRAPPRARAGRHLGRRVRAPVRRAAARPGRRRRGRHGPPHPGGLRRPHAGRRPPPRRRGGRRGGAVRRRPA